MGFKEQISKEFPNVTWTGESGIHVSLWMGCSIPIDFDNAKKMLKLFDTVKMGEKVYRILLSKFPNAEFLMDAEDFHKLFMADAARFLAGLGSLETPARIQNPVTGNQFHRMALHKDYVGGFRFWLQDIDDDLTDFGFRFRWVGLLGEEEENVRLDARERVRIAQEEYAEVENSIMEVAEPPAAVVSEFEAQLEKL